MAVYGRKKSAIKAKAVQPQSMQPQASLADVEYLMSHAIGRYHDQYLQQLALSVVQLQSMQEITQLQSDIIRRQSELSKEAEKIAQNKSQLTQAKRAFTLKIKDDLKSKEPEQTYYGALKKTGKRSR